MNTRTARLSGRVLPAVLLAALVAGCTGGGTTGPDSTAVAAAPPSAAAGPSAPATGADDPALKPFYGQQIAWAACPDDPTTDKLDESAFQCGRLRVPLDYAAPAGEAVEVALTRSPAAHAAERIGSLLVNPGGPGGSGVQLLLHGSKIFDGALHDRFDLVGFDPRGVGDSTAVHCLDDRTRDRLLSTDSGQDDGGRTFAEACRATSGPLLDHVGTKDAARDMDVLRAALGDQKLNYLGFSYGTYLGSSYAEQFPGRTGRLVLDGAVDPTADQLDLLVQQVTGFEKSLRAFAADCTRHTDCSLGKDPDRAAQKLADFLDGLHDKPLRTADGRTLTAGLGWTGTIGMLYGDRKDWEYLRNAVGRAMVRGKGDDLLGMADNYNDRGSDGHYGNAADAYTAIHCADPGSQTPSPERQQAALRQIHEQAPLVGGHFTERDLFDPDCRAWTFHTTEQPHPVKAAGSAPILVVGSTGDPATPYAWAEKLAAGLEHGTLLTREGEGHTAYGKSGCIKAAVDAYLTEGTVPAAGTRCGSD
ncbi:alpha/beta hydrolase [Kitasatospora sp. NPDC088346]|uniref:alpha/beta hydrolase n=1 Tax=Kitasatospora sp. NPDC088346 TaxID=3364073 RepID=UPI0038172E75